MKTAFLLPALCCAFFIANLLAATPDELRAEAEKLMRQAEMLRAEARAKAGDGEQPKGDDARQERVKQEIGELHRAGKYEEAKRLERQLAEAHHRRAGGEKKVPHAEGPERIGHIMEAVKHLRMAGLGEPAESLEQMAAQMREALEHGGTIAVGAERMEHALREVHEGMEQLRRQMEKMQRELGELRERAARQRAEADKG